MRKVNRLSPNHTYVSMVIGHMSMQPSIAMPAFVVRSIGFIRLPCTDMYSLSRRPVLKPPYLNILVASALPAKNSRYSNRKRSWPVWSNTNMFFDQIWFTMLYVNASLHPLGYADYKTINKHTSYHWKSLGIELYSFRNSPMCNKYYTTTENLTSQSVLNRFMYFHIGPEGQKDGEDKDLRGSWNNKSSLPGRLQKYTVHDNMFASRVCFIQALRLQVYHPHMNSQWQGTLGAPSFAKR